MGKRNRDEKNARIVFVIGVMLSFVTIDAWSQNIDYLFRTWNATDNTVSFRYREAFLTAGA